MTSCLESFYILYLMLMALWLMGVVGVGVEILGILVLALEEGCLIVPTG